MAEETVKTTEVTPQTEVKTTEVKTTTEPSGPTLKGDGDGGDGGVKVIKGDRD